MPKTKVVNIKNGDQFDVYIGRPGNGHDGYFGNPFTTPPHTRNKSIQLFEQYALDRINSDPEYKQKVKELYGKTLGCFCKPKACHGDVLVKLTKQINMEYSVFDNHDK